MLGQPIELHSDGSQLPLIVRTFNALTIPTSNAEYVRSMLTYMSDNPKSTLRFNTYGEPNMDLYWMQLSICVESSTGFTISPLVY